MNNIKKNKPKFRELNARIHNVQDKIVQEAIKLDRDLKKRCEDKNDVLDDYEIEIEVRFLLKVGDKEYSFDDDNILATLIDYPKGSSTGEKDHWWGDTNHNDFAHWEDHPMQGEHHCWWFHSLYDHVHLDFEDMLRIGEIWTDIKVHHQYYDDDKYANYVEKDFSRDIRSILMRNDPLNIEPQFNMYAYDSNTIESEEELKTARNACESLEHAYKNTASDINAQLNNAQSEHDVHDVLCRFFDACECEKFQDEVWQLVTDKKCYKRYEYLSKYVDELLYYHDPVHIAVSIDNPHIDEYSGETDAILSQLHRAHSVSDLTKIVYDIFDHFLSLSDLIDEVDDLSVFENIAQDIWKLKNNIKTKKDVESILSLCCLPAPTCIFCNKKIEDVKGERFVSQTSRGTSVTNVAREKEVNNNKTFIQHSIELPTQPITFMNYWGEESKWTKAAVNRAKQAYLDGQQPWYCEKCCEEICNKTRMPKSGAVSAKVVHKHGYVINTVIVPPL